MQSPKEFWKATLKEFLRDLWKVFLIGEAIFEGFFEVISKGISCTILGKFSGRITKKHSKVLHIPEGI